MRVTALRNAICALRKTSSESCLFPSTMWETERGTRKHVVTRLQICLDLDFPASRTERNQFVTYKPPSLWYWYSSLNRHSPSKSHRTSQQVFPSSFPSAVQPASSTRECAYGSFTRLASPFLLALLLLFPFGKGTESYSQPPHTLPRRQDHRALPARKLSSLSWMPRAATSTPI